VINDPFHPKLESLLRTSSAVAIPEEAMSNERRNRQEDTYFRVLRLLRDNPEMSQRQLAETVGSSLGAMNYVLRALVDKGFVKLGNFSSSPNKRRYAYILTPEGMAAKAAITKNFLARKRAEYEALSTEIDTLTEELNRETAEQDHLK
jgi:EPS-associated MarR family transcriptional regulator